MTILFCAIIILHVRVYDSSLIIGTSGLSSRRARSKQLVNSILPLILSLKSLLCPLSLRWCGVLEWIKALDNIFTFLSGRYPRILLGQSYDDIRALADSIRDIAKRQHTSKKSGRKIFSSLHRISGISFFRRFTTCTEMFLLHSFQKKFPSSATASYTSGRTKSC